MAERVGSRMVQVPHNGSKVPAFLSRPLSSSPRPGVVVIQEWWGLEPHIKDVAQRFAREGYVAIAPDLYHGQVVAEPDEARKLMMALDQERAVREIISTVAYLKRLTSCTGKVATVGFCMGGKLSLLTACRSAGLAGTVVYYGGAPDPLDQVKHLECPLLGLYGEADTGIPVSTVRALEEKVREYGKQFLLHIYPEAPHAFFNDTRASFRQAPAEDSWRRVLFFFKQHLR